MSSPVSASQARIPNVTPDENRRSADFPPGIWGDKFLLDAFMVRTYMKA